MKECDNSTRKMHISSSFILSKLYYQLMHKNVIYCFEIMKQTWFPQLYIHYNWGCWDEARPKLKMGRGVGDQTSPNP